MSDKLSENLQERKKNADPEFNNIMTSEELETFEIVCFKDALASSDGAQSSHCENTETDDSNIVNDKDNQAGPDIPENQYSGPEESDDEPFVGDIWDDFKLAKHPMQKFDNKQAEKNAKNNFKLQKRPKAMVRSNPIATVEFDEQTKVLLRKLVLTRHVSRFVHIIGTGRNSVVLYAYKGTSHSIKSSWQVVVKVYDNSEAAHKRAQNELKSLECLDRWRINGPKPICAWRNVIVMSTVGYGRTARSIRNARSELDLKNYLYIIDSMKRMYQMGKIVHGNLSHRSITMWYGEPHFISLSHSVPADHKDALKLLIKDCYSVTHLFKDKGLSELKTTEELFKFVTDLPEIDETLLKILSNIKPSDSKTDPINYNSKYQIAKPNYAAVLEFCTNIHQ